MTVLDIKNITTEDSYIYYRKSYTGTAIVEFQTMEELPINFLIETSPLGTKTVEVTLKKDVHYPLLPIIKGLKSFILKKDQEGSLP
ncbi:MAG: hypothetical protein SPI86_00225 [Treponemataceae bacterium]|nr:hypothetical protein [Spirochaetales bacterium]MDY6030164.1 hypothetical protein [Treponemataceae bacterium]